MMRVRATICEGQRGTLEKCISAVSLYGTMGMSE